MIIHKNQGMIALTTVLIVGAIVLAVSIGITTRTVIETQISGSEEQTHKALVAATSCMESALAKLSDNASYTGNESISVGSNTCTISTITSSGNTRTVKTSSTVGGHTRRLSVTVSNVNPPLQVSSWQEVDS
jgi:hypothetical protein